MRQDRDGIPIVAGLFTFYGAMLLPGSILQLGPLGSGPETTFILAPIHIFFLLGYSTVAIGVSVFIAGRLGKTQPLWHSLVCGAVLLLAVAIDFGLSLALGEDPGWWDLLLILLAIPSIWAGSRLATTAVRVQN